MQRPIGRFDVEGNLLQTFPANAPEFRRPHARPHVRSLADPDKPQPDGDGQPDEAIGPIPGKDGRKAVRRAGKPNASVRAIQKAIDQYRWYRDFRTAIDNADDRTRSLRPIRAEDLPERFQAAFDPSFDTPSQLEADEMLYAAALAEAIGRHSGSGQAGPVHFFLDPRDGCGWVLLPSGISARPADSEAESGGLEVAINGRTIGFPAGRSIEIPVGWIEIEDAQVSLVIDADGVARLGN